MGKVIVSEAYFLEDWKQSDASKGKPVYSLIEPFAICSTDPAIIVRKDSLTFPSKDLHERN